MNHPELWPAVGLTAALLMIRLGVQLNALESRRRPRPCPACGRAFSGRICPACTARR